MRELGNRTVSGKRGKPADAALIIDVAVITQPTEHQDDDREDCDEDHLTGDRGVNAASEARSTGAASIRVSEKKVIRNSRSLSDFF
jgi:hypothetical protein